MNYYRRYVGDYGKKTRDLSIIEHGVYGLLLDAYYSTEKPLPAEFDRLYRICSAINAAEQEAVRLMADKFFPIGSDGLRHNDRADEELATAIPEIEASRKNGGRGGRPKKPNGNPTETQRVPKHEPKENPTGSEKETQQEPSGIQPSSFNHQPPTPNPQEPTLNPKQRFPGVDSTTTTAATAGAAALKDLKAKPLSLDEARIDSADPTTAGILASVCIANSIRATAFHPLVIEWVMIGVTVDRLKHAIATAKQRKGEAQIPLAYLDPILRDERKAVDSGWKRDDAKASQLCGELGIPGPKRGEEMTAFHGRVEQALADRARSTVQ